MSEFGRYHQIGGLAFEINPKTARNRGKFINIDIKIPEIKTGKTNVILLHLTLAVDVTNFKSVRLSEISGLSGVLYKYVLLNDNNNKKKCN